MSNVVVLEKDTRYKLAVRRGRELIRDYESKVNEWRKEAERLQWQLGDLANEIAKEYGTGAVKKFAEDLNIMYSTLQSYRTTALAWPDKKSRRRDFTVHQELNTHPRREQIAHANPDMSKRHARAKVRQYKAKQETKELPPEPNDEVNKEELWQNSVSEFYGWIIAARAHWTKNFGQWENFSIPSYIKKGVEQADVEWKEIVKHIKSRK